jgi:hypothetical protein
MDKLFININNLPTVLIDIINDFVPKVTSTFLSKTNYLKTHYLVKRYIRKNKLEDYIRCMIRQDNDFVLIQLLKENYDKWSNKLTNYFYKGTIHPNYIIFLEDYSIDNESHKCKDILTNLIKENGLRKNIIKKI